MKLRDVLLGWDLWAATAAAVLCWTALPPWVSLALGKDIYNMGVTVLSIVFAVFFTALAVIIATGDDDFVRFLKELKIYSGLVDTFRFTLLLLFLALMVSVVAFCATAAGIEKGYEVQSRWAIAGFAFLFFYSLFSVMYSTSDAIGYARRRIDFVENKDKLMGGDGPTPNGAGPEETP